MKTLVSSANKIENNLLGTFGGPKIDSCGTPQATVLEIDLELFIVTYCIFIKLQAIIHRYDDLCRKVM